jgi:hypothetical protein
MQSRRYAVTVQGRLSERFRCTFPGVSMEPGPGQTLLITDPFDQAELHGLLNRVRDFGFDLLAVEALPAGPVTSQVAQPRATIAKTRNHPG